MRTFTATLTLLLAINLAIPTLSFAYLDAGTGSILLQAVLAGVAGGFVVIKMYWRKVLAMFRGSKS